MFLYSINTSRLSFMERYHKETLAKAISMNKEYFINVVSIIIQMVIGALTYFVTLIILKDDYVFRFIEKIKGKLFKKEKVAE